MEQLAVDIGGTFVDAVHFVGDGKTLRLQKASTTPDNPSDGVLDALDKIGADLAQTDAFVHGTTLGINAILEREGANTGIITNERFIDIFEAGRYDRPHDEMFNPMYRKPDPLVPRYQRKGIPGRLNSDGEVLESIDDDAVVEAVAEVIEDHGVDSIAVCLLHSYQNPEHERRVAEIVQREFPDVSISLSSDLTREYREYERTSTAVLDAYIKPTFNSYVDELAGRLYDGGFDGSFFLTRSGGGALVADAAREMPVHTIMSGPAGGLIGASFIGESTGYDDLIAADIGGTSTDTCVIQSGSPHVEHEATIGTNPMLIPSYDIRTIGSGGGSIAWLDEGLLKVGPKSAGADPGPICYGRGGTEPTVTDAAVILGYIDPEAFVGGEMTLDVAAAEDGVATNLADPLDMGVREACQGVFDVLTADIINAVNEITVERGLDPRDFGLLAYGGAGPLIMPLVARELDVEAVFVPPAPGVFSAWGMLLADVVYDFARTHIVGIDETDAAALAEQFADLEERARERLAAQGFDSDARSLERSAEMRYAGQEHTVEVAAGGVDTIDDLEARFHERYETRYGHRMTDPVEVVHLRVRATGETNKPELQEVEAVQMSDAGAGGQVVDDTREAYCVAAGEFVEFDVRRRSDLAQHETVLGPAIVQEPTSTILVFSDQEATIDNYRNLKIEAK